jgi:hypothetical protein
VPLLGLCMHFILSPGAACQSSLRACGMTAACGCLHSDAFVNASPLSYPSLQIGLVKAIQSASRQLCHRQMSWFRDEEMFRRDAHVLLGAVLGGSARCMLATTGC